MKQDDEEQSAVEQLQEMIDGLSEDDNFLFIVQSEQGENAAQYKAFSTGDYNTTVNAAVVALTLAGKDIIANSDEDADPNDPGMDSRAFFYGLQALSRTANQWAAQIKAEQEANQEGPKHVKETVEDSGGSADAANPPRTANDGSSIH